MQLKKEENLKQYIQQLINLRCEIDALKQAQWHLKLKKAIVVIKI